MLIIESPIFTKALPDYLCDDEYRKLQSYLLENPSAGKLIPGMHGLRKLRWQLGTKGKRSGTRIIYYWEKPKEQIYLLMMYAKNVSSNLSPREKNELLKMMERW